jgi:hypothetical protein
MGNLRYEEGSRKASALTNEGNLFRVHGKDFLRKYLALAQKKDYRENNS